MNKDTDNNLYPDISGIFDIDEKDIPKKPIKKDPDAPQITEPILTSDEAKKHLPPKERKAYKKEEKSRIKAEKKNARRVKFSIISGVLLAVLLISGIINFVVADSKKPSVELHKVSTETLTRYYEAQGITYKSGSSLCAVFIDNDYDVHFIEKGQKATITLKDNTVINGVVTDIKEESPTSVLISKHYTVLTDTLPSTDSYAVFIQAENASLLPQEGTVISVRTETKTVENAITVPAEAVRLNGNQYFVWKYDKFTKTLTRQDVNIGMSSDGKTEITSGLEKGDRIAFSFSRNPDTFYEGITVKTG